VTGSLTLQEALRNRTRTFAMAVVRLSADLPLTAASRVIGNQLLRSATSVAANYRSCGRARSHRDFVSRIAIVLEEADETLFWLELIGEATALDPKLLEPLIKEAGELVLIFSAPQATATRRRRPGSGKAPVVAPDPSMNR